MATKSLPAAIPPLIGIYIGGAVLLIALLTITRAMFSLGAIPFLIGRGVRRLLTRR
ncbi:MAG: hypothetical protein ACR2NR_00245 [Solirubrobacteraceae bacterium]